MRRVCRRSGSDSIRSGGHYPGHTKAGSGSVIFSKMKSRIGLISTAGVENTWSQGGATRKCRYRSRVMGKGEHFDQQETRDDVGLNVIKIEECQTSDF